MIRKSWRFVRAALVPAALLLTLPVQAAFTVNGDGTVTDSATGLMWDQCSWGQSGATCANSATVRNWPQALAVAVTANAMNSGTGYKSHADWRLPNKNELETLADITLVSPAVDTTVFPNTADVNYWSSTNFAPDPTSAWYVNFGDGHLIANAKTLHLYVRLVRSGPSFSHFDALAPSSPFNVVAVLSNASAKVSFSAPGDNGAVLSGYTVRATPQVSGAGPRAVQGNSAAAIDIDAGTLSLSHTVTGLVNGTAYTFTVVAHGIEGDSLESLQSDPIVPSPLAAPLARLVNISTRMQVLTGNDVMIGGFIVGGSASKTVVVRARGPSMLANGITNYLANPMLQLFSGPNQIAFNDNWQTADNQATLLASGFAPDNPFEAAIYTTLAPGAYTAIVTGVGSTTGVGIIEVFEVDKPEVPLINISTRGQVLTDNDVMIGGFIIQGSSPQTVVVRARGPSMLANGISDYLANPMLQLFSGPNQIAVNDDWQTASNQADLLASGFAPSDPKEAALLITLNPGAYTVIVTGVAGITNGVVSDGTGVGIIEVFAQ